MVHPRLPFWPLASMFKWKIIFSRLVKKVCWYLFMTWPTWQHWGWVAINFLGWSLLRYFNASPTDNLGKGQSELKRERDRVWNNSKSWNFQEQIRMTCAQCANCVKDLKSSWKYFSSHIFSYGFKIYIKDFVSILALRYSPGEVWGAWSDWHELKSSLVKSVTHWAHFMF